MESLAQLGVQLLLFTLGLEFSMAKLRAVRSVALLGGFHRSALEVRSRLVLETCPVAASLTMRPERLRRGPSTDA